MIDLFSDETRRNPYPAYDMIRAASPTLHAPQLDLWMVFDYDGVKRVLSEHETFSSSLESTSRGSGPEWFIFFDPPRHSRLRGLISRAFTPVTVAGLEPRVRELSRELLGRAVQRGAMDLVTDFAVPLPTAVIAEMLGLPVDDRPRFVRWSEIILRLSHFITGGPESSAAAAEYRATTVEMAGYLGDLTARRRAEPRADLLTRLVEAEVDGERLSEHEILNFVQLLLIAGTETTTNLIANAVLCFTENPTQLARLELAPEHLLVAIEEVLRYRSPVQAVFRATKRDVELHGETVPAGSLVLAMVGSANRDPKAFANAGVFDIARDPNLHVAFGHGIHFCIGAALARLEGRVALEELLGSVANITLEGDGTWPPRAALHVHGPASLPIRFEPRGNGTARRP